MFVNKFVKNNITSQASFVEVGYGQVEPNHLSAQRTGQIYAQLPADKDIDVLENGQFVKYDYMNGVCNFTGKGEWMLVYNEIKLYRDHQLDCEFAMKKGDYAATLYSPSDRDTLANDATLEYPLDYTNITAPDDMYEPYYTDKPFAIDGKMQAKKMPEGTVMVPRVFKTNIGDIMTLNTINETELELGDELSPAAADGILCKGGDGSMIWQVVKIYTMPDHQKGVKVMRIA